MGGRQENAVSSMWPLCCSNRAGCSVFTHRYIPPLCRDSCVLQSHHPNCGWPEVFNHFKFKPQHIKCEEQKHNKILIFCKQQYFLSKEGEEKDTRKIPFQPAWGLSPAPIVGSAAPPINMQSSHRLWGNAWNYYYFEYNLVQHNY